MLIPKYGEPKYRSLRAGVFIVLGFSVCIPLIFQAFTKFKWGPYYLPTTNGWTWLYGGFVYAGGAIIYALRLPEKFFPKRFDLVGASH